MVEKLILSGLELFAFHGVNPEEKQEGQTFLLDLTLWAALSAACRSDRLADTVNYAAVLKCAAHTFTENRCDLIERAAQLTAQAILDEFPAIDRLTLRVHKPDAPVQCRVADIALEIERRREGSLYE
ncbi:MAG: dihydroneopterin aldolase [Oscillospiraceae bacterium]|jgi:dihydroneopterin aldolase|nr:dihydroneopterin aldolase [Oscillospiraceae bacterium]